MAMEEDVRGPAKWKRPNPSEGHESSKPMDRRIVVILYVAAMAAVIVGVDLAFFRHRLWFLERLLVNVGIVLVFAAFYLRFLRP